MMTLYFVRHGYSTGNRNKIFYGHYDGELDVLGHKQAECVAEYFRNIHLDCIFSSDLVRAYDTVEPLAQQKNMKIITDKRLREIFAGEWENKSVEELFSGEYAKDYGVWKNDIARSRCTGGESVSELRERVYGAVLDIAQNNDKKTVLISTHATPIRVLKSCFLGEDISKINDYGWVPNASVSKITYDNGNWNIEFFGESGHLASLVTTLDLLF
ncbi:MAG: histidine phosphatase family protein [Clostridia bacterium]|nr:histidine phosphatase family protein [Clostridia bacterium]